MPTTRRAVIDVGTNSVKLLVADVSGRDVAPVFEDGNQTRLGEGSYETHKLTTAAIARTAAAAGECAALARKHGATTVRVFATSAARDAANSRDLVLAIEQSCGLKLEIISGAQEALWTFQGVQTQSMLVHEPLLMVEVGGGSTQFIFGQRDEIHFRESFPLGAVRLMEQFPNGDPPTPAALNSCRAWLAEFLAEHVTPTLVPALRREEQQSARRRAVNLVAVGGTATVLARMAQGMDDWDREKIEAARLSRDELRGWVERLWSLPLAERRKIRGMPPERADVILTGAAIYAAVLAALDFAELRVSSRGVRFAALLEAN